MASRVTTPTRGAIRIVVTLFLTAVMVVAGVAQVHADGEERFTHYEVDVHVGDDGVLTVELDLGLDLAGNHRHGPYLTFVRTQEISGDRDHLRRYEYRNFWASSDDAPARMEVFNRGRTLEAYIGEDGRPITGQPRYRIGFDVDGMLNPGVGENGEDEIFWNVIGGGYEHPLEGLVIRVTGVGPILDAQCWYGKLDSEQTCRTDLTDDGVTFDHPRLEAGEHLTIGLSYPAGTFTNATTLLVPRGTEPGFGTASALGAGLGGGLVVMGGVIGWSLLARRDRTHLRTTPGLTAVEPKNTPVGPAPLIAAATVQFNPPPLTPAEVGIVVDAKRHKASHAAMIISLANRGNLTIEGHDDGDWTLHRLAADQEELSDYEQKFLEVIFRDGDRARLRDLPMRDRQDLHGADLDLFNTRIEEWFSGRLGDRELAHMVVGGLLIVAGLISLGIGYLTGRGWVGLPVLGAGIGVLVVIPWVRQRTPLGRAMYMQAMGFKKYLSTADQHRLEHEVGEETYSAYLPYAMVLGVVDQWMRTFERISHAPPAPPWWTPEEEEPVPLWTQILTNKHLRDPEPLSTPPPAPKRSSVSAATTPAGSSWGAGSRSAETGRGRAGRGTGGSGGGTW